MRICDRTGETLEVLDQKNHVRGVALASGSGLYVAAGWAIVAYDITELPSGKVPSVKATVR